MSRAPAGRDAWRLVVAPLVVSRLLWLVVAIVVVGTTLGGTPLIAGLRSTLLQWDAISYVDIAKHGYPSALDYHDAFLPGYPLLLRAASWIVRDEVLAGWLLGVACEAVALWYIARLVLAERDRAAARFAVWLVALAPTAM
ncbi:MAG TPA: hypothetical protein VJU79_00805, partial [Candidatus Dormibacteraeota bacterium]|nr:hypothetical protein [Candidatus Dormibacteraeota bacterium]